MIEPIYHGITVAKLRELLDGLDPAFAGKQDQSVTVAARKLQDLLRALPEDATAPRRRPTVSI